MKIIKKVVFIIFPYLTLFAMFSIGFWINNKFFNNDIWSDVYITVICAIISVFIVKTVYHFWKRKS